MGGLLFGYDWVVIGGAKPFYEPYFGITDDNTMRAVAMSVALLGCLVGAMIAGVLAEISLRPLLAARAVHLPLSVALFWLGSTVPVQAVQTFTTLTERVVVLRRVPLDCALLAFAVCCITVEELARS